MPRYADDSPPRERRSHRRPPPGYDGDTGDDYNARRRASRPRDSKYDEPPSSGRHRRKDDYDASDEDDHEPRRRSSHDIRSGKGKGSPDLPHPPIGEDRRATAPDVLDAGDHRGGQD